MRTHHNLAEVAGRHKDESVMPIAKALTSYIDEALNGGSALVDKTVYRTAHYDPIVLGFIIGRNWPACQEEALAAIAADLEYDRMIIRVSPKAPSGPSKIVKGLDVSKLEFKL